MLQLPFILRNITNWIYGNWRHIELSHIELKVDESKILQFDLYLEFWHSKSKKKNLEINPKKGEKINIDNIQEVLLRLTLDNEDEEMFILFIY